MELQDIGELIRFYAKQKGIPLRRIYKDTGMSTATFVRLRLEPQKVKLETLYKFLNSLDLELQIVPKTPVIEVKAV